MDRPWTSAIIKEPVHGPLWVDRMGVQGDAQADRRHHGGADKAVLAYAAVHYAAWRIELPQCTFPPGAFGENLTIEGLTEHDMAIGDVVKVGSATLQVSQPRQPCWKLARRFRVPDMVERVQATLRSGWYLRVLEAGEFQPGDVVTRLERPHPEWTVARASGIMYGSRNDDSAARLAALPELSDSWTRTLNLRASGAVIDTAARVSGPDDTGGDRGP